MILADRISASESSPSSIPRVRGSLCLLHLCTRSDPPLEIHSLTSSRPPNTIDHRSTNYSAIALIPPGYPMKAYSHRRLGFHHLFMLAALKLQSPHGGTCKGIYASIYLFVRKQLKLDALPHIHTVEPYLSSEFNPFLHLTAKAQAWSLGN